MALTTGGSGDVGKFSARRGDEDYFLSTHSRPGTVLRFTRALLFLTTELRGILQMGKLRGKEVKWLA